MQSIDEITDLLIEQGIDLTKYTDWASVRKVRCYFVTFMSNESNLDIVLQTKCGSSFDRIFLSRRQISNWNTFGE